MVPARQATPATVSALEDEIRHRIAIDGPMPLSHYMTLCLSHPRYGYYVTRDPLGAAGDFTTAPEITQMFGELIGLWVVSVWRAMGAPDPVHLVELGPGRGTLMRDALRTCKKVAPDFRAALAVHLVEISPALRQQQEKTLRDAGVPIQWYTALADVPAGPVIVIANEFVDALAVRQAVKQETGWHERVVGVDDRGKLAFGLAPDPLPRFDRALPPALRAAAPGAVFEWRSNPTIVELCGRVAASAGAALVIDYGHTASAAGDTLQAVTHHRSAGVLDAPGTCDLTAHVDFEAMAAAARAAGARVHGPVTQAQFLRASGIATRAGALKRTATKKQAAEIDTALARLTSEEPTGMGAMFKAIALSHNTIAAVPGFDR